jgi:hypothetical protein
VVARVPSRATRCTGRPFAVVEDVISGIANDDSHPLQRPVHRPPAARTSAPAR